MIHKSEDRIPYSQKVVEFILLGLRGIKSDSYSEFTSLEIAQVMQIVLRHGLAGFFLSHPAYRNYPLSFQNEIKRLYFSVSVHNTQVFQTLKRIAADFDANDISFIPLKGLFLLPVLYNDVAGRNISDIDILIQPRDYVKCKQILEELGACQTANDLSPFLASVEHQYPPFVLFNTSIELHARLLSANMKYQVPVELVWQNKIKYHVNNDEIWGLPFHLLILYLALHIHYSAMRGENRVYWYLDIYKLSQKYDLKDNREWYLEAIRLGIEKPVCEVIKRVAFLFGIEIGVIEKLFDNEGEIFLNQLFGSNDIANKGYSIFFERLAHTRGIKNKVRFFYEVVLNRKGGDKSPLFHRINKLIIKTYRYFLSKLRSKM